MRHHVAGAHAPSPKRRHRHQNDDSDHEYFIDNTLEFLAAPIAIGGEIPNARYRLRGPPAVKALIAYALADASALLSIIQGWFSPLAEATTDPVTLARSD
jgi:hypothetical protein